MGITFSSSAITITDGDYNFEDIYQASIDAGNQYCKKLGTSYLISIDVLVGNGTAATTLSGENISVIIEGDLFQIKKNAELKIGTKNATTGGTSNGCYISCPNIKLAYGFGSTSVSNGVTQSGNIFLYDSFIDIYGFWGFFGGSNQHCEVIDCLVNGFGRIEGSNSILQNITTQASQGRYGSLATKGTIKTYENVSSKKVNEYKGHACSVYFNSEFVLGMRVIGGTYDGYSEGLCYLEPGKGSTTEENTITFVDSEIKNGYGGYFADSNTRIKVVYTFAPVFKNPNGSALAYVDVSIVDNNGTEIFNGSSNENGEISVEIANYFAGKNFEENYPYFDVTATYNDITITRRYETGVSYFGCPFFIVEESTGSGAGDACTCDNIQAKLDALQDALMTKIDNSISDTENNIKIHTNRNRDSIIDVVVNGDGTNPGNLEINTKIERLLEMSEGNYKVINNQMIFYKRDGSEFMRFDLKDDKGDATMNNAYSREAL